MTRHGVTLASALIALAALCFTGTASAEPAQCDVLAISASSSGSGIPQDLEAYQEQLVRPPLNVFNSFQLLGRQHLQLDAGASQALNLRSDITGELRFESRSGGLLRLRLVLRRGGQTLLNTQLATSPGHPFFVAGPLLQDGTLVVGIVCR